MSATSARFKPLARRARRLLTQPGRRDKVRRKLRTFLARRRPAVRANRARLERELADKADRLESHPTTLILDPVTACNLECPFCPTGGGYGTIKKERLTPEVFERIVGHLRPELLEEVVLYNWGEPFLNRHVTDYVRVFSRLGAYTEISTNLSMKDFDQDFFERLVDSGLTELKVSVDGASQATYEKYRVGGDFERVVGNMKRLAAVKRARRRSYPHVTYRMLLNKHNQHDVERAARIAEECGADFNPDPGFWCPEEERDAWMADAAPGGAPTVAAPTVAAPQSPGPVPAAGGGDAIETYCRQLWDTVVVNANGDVYPCCLIYKPEHRLGNLAEQPLDEVRNAPRARTLRRFVVDPAARDPDFDNHCAGCSERHCVVKVPILKQQPRG